MKCTTAKKQVEEADAQPAVGTLGVRWEGILQQLPAGWEEQATHCGALVRRRGIRTAQALLQLILAYAVGDWSLRRGLTCGLPWGGATRRGQWRR